MRKLQVRGGLTGKGRVREDDANDPSGPRDICRVAALVSPLETSTPSDRVRHPKPIVRHQKARGGRDADGAATKSGKTGPQGR